MFALSLKDSIDEVNEAIERQNREFAAHIAEVLAAADREFDRQQEDGQVLGRRGWTMPIWAPLHSAPFLVERIPPERIDEFFLREYSKRKPPRTRLMFEALASCKPLIPWQPLLKECIASFRKNQFLVVVPSLLLVLEGLLAHSAGTLKRKSRIPPGFDSRVASGDGG